MIRVFERIVPEPALAPVIFPEMMAGTHENVVPGLAEVRFSVKVVFEQMVADIGLLVTFGLALTNRLTESERTQLDGLCTVTLYRLCVPVV